MPRPLGAMPPSTKMPTSFGALFTSKTKPAPKYLNPIHRQKMQARGNLERASQVPLEDGNWIAALQVMTTVFRRPGLTAVHLEDAITIGMREQLNRLQVHYNNPNMGRVSDLAARAAVGVLESTASSSREGEGKATTGEGDGGTLPPNAIVHPNPRDLPSSAYAFAKMLMNLRDECAEGTLPQSISLWEQLVTNFASLGLLHEAIDTADLAIKANQVYKKGEMTRKDQTVMMTTAAGGKIVSSISKETMARMGRVLLPLAASQGKMSDAQDIAKVFFNYKDREGERGGLTGIGGATSQNDAFVRMWLAEGASAIGDWAYALRIGASLSSRSVVSRGMHSSTPSSTPSGVPDAFKSLSRDSQRSSLLSASSDGSWEVALHMAGHMYQRGRGDVPVGDLPAILNALGIKQRAALQQKKQGKTSSNDAGASNAPWVTALDLFVQAFPCVAADTNAAGVVMPTGDVSQQSADLLFALLPAPDTPLVVQKLIPEKSSSKLNATLEHVSTEGSKITVDLLNRLCFNTDTFAITMPVAHAAARSLLWLSCEGKQQQGVVGGGWARALALMRSSPLVSRAAVSKGGAGPLESDLAALVRCMELHGPSAEARLAALTWFPHLIPKEVFPHRLQQHMQALNMSTTPPPSPSSSSPVEEEPTPYRLHADVPLEEGQDMLPPSHPLYPYPTYSSAGLPVEGRNLISNTYVKPRPPLPSSPLAGVAIEEQPKLPINFQPFQKSSSWHSMSKLSPRPQSSTVVLDPEYEAMRQATTLNKDSAFIRPSTTHYFKDHLERKTHHEAHRKEAMTKIKVTERAGFPLYLQGDATTRYNTILSTRPVNHPTVIAAGGQQQRSAPSFGVFDDTVIGASKRDPFSDPRAAPFGLNDLNNGYSYYKHGGGGVVKKTSTSIASPMMMRPKHFAKLKDPLRSWKESTVPFMGVSPVKKFSPGKAL